METEREKITGRGGYRPNSGRPKGAVDPTTAKKNKAEKQFKRWVYKDSRDFYLAQKKLALGVTVVVKRELDAKTKKWGKYEIVTDPKEIVRFLNGKTKPNVEYFDVVTSKPDNAALQGLLDRAFGKAKESIEMDHTNDPITSVSIKIIKSKNELSNRGNNSTSTNN